MQTQLCPPPHTPPTLPTPSNPSPNTNTVLDDALTLRRKVFIDEQNCSPANETDADDLRSWHWVVYSRTRPEEINLGRIATGTTTGSTTGSTTGHGNEALLAIGVIRLVPPPHAPHCLGGSTAETPEGSPKHGHEHEQAHEEEYDMLHEPYIKLTRVAVLPEYRGKGIARHLVETAVDWARQWPGEIQAAADRVRRDVYDANASAYAKWNGLVLVHAQVSVEGMYQRLGFKTDEGMGRWDEEGIDHVGMWRRGYSLKS